MAESGTPPQGPSPAPVPLIEARQIEKWFELGNRRIHVLRQVDVELQAGDMVGIVGRSGSGKSTLLHLMGTLDRPSGGTIRYDGESIEQCLDFAAPSQQLFLDRPIAAAGDDAGGLHDIAVGRHQSHPTTVLPPGRDSGSQIGHQHHIAEQGLGHRAKRLLESNQVQHALRGAVHLRRAMFILARVQRDETAAPLLLAAQPVDRAGAFILAADDDVL